MNGGLCIKASNTTFQCLCLEDFTGNSCESSLDCRDNPCMNGGLCIKSSNASFTCLCLSDFTGDNCESSTKKCYSSNCMNRGICVENLKTGNYSCICDCTYKYMLLTGHKENLSLFKK